MDNTPIGQPERIGGRVIRALGGSAERSDSHTKWEKESSERAFVRMTRKQQRMILDEILTKVVAQDYDLLDHHPESGFFADCFIIGISNKNGSFYRAKLGNADLRVMTDLTVFWVEGLEFIPDIFTPRARRFNMVMDCLRDDVWEPSKVKFPV